MSDTDYTSALAVPRDFVEFAKQLPETVRKKLSLHEIRQIHVVASQERLKRDGTDVHAHMVGIVENRDARIAELEKEALSSNHVITKQLERVAELERELSEAKRGQQERLPVNFEQLEDMGARIRRLEAERDRLKECANKFHDGLIGYMSAGAINRKLIDEAFAIYDEVCPGDD